MKNKMSFSLTQEELECLYNTVNRVISEEAAFANYATPEDEDDPLMQDSIEAYQNAVASREILRRVC